MSDRAQSGWRKVYRDCFKSEFGRGVMPYELAAMTISQFILVLASESGDVGEALADAEWQRANGW